MVRKIMRLLQRLVGLYTSMLIKRDSNLFVFGAWFGHKYSDNPKYLYRYCIENNMNAVWITKDEKVYRHLKEENLPVAMAYSREGKHYCRTGKYIFTSTDICFDVNENCIGNAVLINLWHGIPIKKIMWDDTINGKYYSIGYRIVNALLKYPLKKQYMLSTSPTMTTIFQQAFKLLPGRVLELGQSRNDGFFNGGFRKMKYGHIEYERLVVYLPTHRNEGKSKMNLDEILPLNEIESFCERNRTLFLIKKHYYHNSEEDSCSSYNYITDYTGTNIDTQEVLYNADVLITDYSSCYIDYLLLDRPIIFYPYDYEEYQKVDREMYFKYEDVTPDEVAINKHQLLISLEKVCNDNYVVGEKQKQIKEMFYSKANQGEVSPKIIETILKLS